MKITIGVPTWVFSILWLIQDRCTECGGEWDEGHITGDRECKKCGYIDRA